MRNTEIIEMGFINNYQPTLNQYCFIIQEVLADQNLTRQDTPIRLGTLTQLDTHTLLDTPAILNILTTLDIRILLVTLTLLDTLDPMDLIKKGLAIIWWIILYGLSTCQLMMINLYQCFLLTSTGYVYLVCKPSKFMWTNITCSPRVVQLQIKS